MNTHNNDVKVEFTVLVPQGVRFVGRSVNGDVEANSLAALALDQVGQAAGALQ
jgi:hypothetical protein